MPEEEMEQGEEEEEDRSSTCRFRVTFTTTTNRNDGRQCGLRFSFRSRSLPLLFRDCIGGLKEHIVYVKVRV
jgi:hypothetical protein